MTTRFFLAIATERDDLASICMVGQIVELLRIEPNEG